MPEFGAHMSGVIFFLYDFNNALEGENSSLFNSYE